MSVGVCGRLLSSVVVCWYLEFPGDVWGVFRECLGVSEGHSWKLEAFRRVSGVFGIPVLTVFSCNIISAQSWNAIWWPNLEVMQPIQVPLKSILKYLIWIFLATEFASFVAGKIIQVREAIPGSVVPLAMFNIAFQYSSNIPLLTFPRESISEWFAPPLVFCSSGGKNITNMTKLCNFENSVFKVLNERKIESNCGHIPSLNFLLS